MSKTTGGLPTLREVRKAEEKEAKQHRSRRTKIMGLAAVGLVVAGAIAFLIYTLISAGASSGSRLASVIPDNADTVVVSPSSKDWWNDVTKMAPIEFSLNSLDPYSAGLDITNLGYARFDDTKQREVKFTGPIRSVYIESSSEEGAAKIEEWLQSQKGNESRELNRSGNIVQVTYNWVKDFETPETSVDSRSDFSLDTTKTTAGMWMNFDNQIDALSGKDNPQKPLVTTYFEKTFALKPGTAWSGTSSDGVTWEGKYVSGGMDANLFDPEAARSKLMDSREAIVENAEGGIYENGLYGLVTNSGAKKTGETMNHGAVEVVSGDFSVKDEKIGVAVEPSQWNPAVRGLSGQPEGVTKIDFSMSESAMNIVFRYENGVYVSDMPEVEDVVIPPGAEVIQIEPGK